MPTRKKLPGRSRLAQVAHFRTSAGEMGGTRKVQAKRRRRQAHAEEREASRQPEEQRQEQSE
jgi:hypothetical protein